MPWQMLWPDFLKKRLCRYLLQHYLGHFFKEKISLEQLTIDIYNGTGCVKNLHLDCEALNEQINAAAFSASTDSASSATSTVPFEIVNGFVGYISVYIPWHDLFNDFCKLTIKNVQITIRTKQLSTASKNSQTKTTSGNNEANDDIYCEEELFENENDETDDNNHSSTSNSMFSSMFIDSLANTSMNIAQECLSPDTLQDELDDLEGNLKETVSAQSKTSLLGLEAFASTIDSILARIKINLEQIQIRIEDLEETSQTFNLFNESNIMSSSTIFNKKSLTSRPSNGIALELRIKSLKYFDLDSVQTQSESQNSSLSNNSNPSSLTNQNTQALVRNTSKSFNIEGFTIYFDEFIVRDEYDLDDLHTKRRASCANSASNENCDANDDVSLNSTLDLSSTTTQTNETSSFAQQSFSLSTPQDEAAPFNFELNPDYYLYTNPILLLTFSGLQSIKLTINNVRPSDLLLDINLTEKNIQRQQRPLLELNAQFGAIKCLMCPKQIHTLTDMFKKMNDYVEQTTAINLNKSNARLNKNRKFKKHIRGFHSTKSKKQNAGNQLFAGGSLTNNLLLGEDEHGLKSMMESSNQLFYSMMSESHIFGHRADSFGASSNKANSSSNEFAHQHGDQDYDKYQSKLSKRIKETLNELKNDVIVFKTDSNHNLFQTFKCTFRMFSLTVLHHDPPSNEESTNKNKRLIVERMKHVCDLYFDWVSTIDTQSSLQANNFSFSSLPPSFTAGSTQMDKNINIKYHQACAFYDHFLLLLKPINLQIVQKINQRTVRDSLQHYSLNDIVVSIGHLQLNEYLVSDQLSKSNKNQTNKSKRFRNTHLIDACQSAQITELVYFTDSSSQHASIEHPCIKLQVVTYQPLDKLKSLFAQLNAANSTDDSMTQYLLSRHFEDISIQLNQTLVFELDISIIDRLYYILNDITKPGSQFKTTSSTSASAAKTDDHKQQTQQSNEKVLRNFEIKANQLMKVALRFPIADLRQSNLSFRKQQTSTKCNVDTKSVSMSAFKRLREQILTLHLFDFHFQTLSNPNHISELLLTLKCSQLNAYYQYSKQERPIHFALIQQQQRSDSTPTNNNSLVCNIQIKSENEAQMVSDLLNKQDALFNQNKENNEKDSLKQHYNININSRGAHKHQSEQNLQHDDDDDEDENLYTPFSRIHSLISSEKNRRIVNAASKSEMHLFSTQAIHQAQTVIKLNLPELKVLIADYKFLNDIYNCVLNDLIMWQASKLPPIESYMYDPNSSLTRLINVDSADLLLHHSNMHVNFGCENEIAHDDEEDESKFKLCRSSIHLDQSSALFEPSNEATDDRPSEQNVDESGAKVKSDESIGFKLKKENKNSLCLVINIDKAHLKAFVTSPMECTSPSGRLRYGEFDVRANNFQMCLSMCDIYNKLNELMERQFISIYVDQINVAHANKQCSDDTDSIKYPTNHSTFENLFHTSLTHDLIKANEPSTTRDMFNQHNQDEHATSSSSSLLVVPMVSIGIKSKFNPKLNTKELLVALNFNDLCLHHTFGTQADFWIFQLIQLFNLIDIEIVGYEAPLVLTELHLNIANSSLSYRPRHIATNAFVTFKSLHWSSNVMADSTLTLLVFNIENIYLFLSKQHSNEFNLKRDFICVANSDLFELRLLINDEDKFKSSNTTNNPSGTRNRDKKDVCNPFARKSPLLDIKIRSNMIQLRTCVDSAYTLIELINYIVSDGDLHVQSVAELGVETAQDLSVEPAGSALESLGMNTQNSTLSNNIETDTVNLSRAINSASASQTSATQSDSIKIPEIASAMGTTFAMGTSPVPSSFKSSSSSTSLNQFYSPMKNFQQPQPQQQPYQQAQQIPSPSLSCGFKPESSSVESLISDMVKEAMIQNEEVKFNLSDTSATNRKRNTSISLDLQSKRMLNEINSELFSSNSTVKFNASTYNDDDGELFIGNKENKCQQNELVEENEEPVDFQFDLPFSNLSPMPTKNNTQYQSKSEPSRGLFSKRQLQFDTKNKRLHFRKNFEEEEETSDLFSPKVGHENADDDDDDDEDANDDDLLREFDIIDVIPGLGEPPKNNQEYEIKLLKKEAKIEIKEEHFKKPLTKIDVLKAPDTYPCPLNVFCIQELSLNWILYDGNDFPNSTPTVDQVGRHSQLNKTMSTTNMMNRTVSSPMIVAAGQSRSRAESTSSLSLSPSYQSPTYQSIQSQQSPKYLVKYSASSSVNRERCIQKAGGRVINPNVNWLSRGGRQRNLDACMEISLHKVKTKIDFYADLNKPNEAVEEKENAVQSQNGKEPSVPYLFRVALAIGDIEIKDKLVSSAFNMFLYRYESENCPKHTNSNMIFLKFLCSKSMDAQRLLECDIKVSIQPLRFNIDQDALLFLIEYFTKMGNKDLNEFKRNLLPPPSLSQPPADLSEPKRQVVVEAEKTQANATANLTPQQIFIRNFIFSPDLLIKFDFSGKYDKRPDNKMDKITKLLMVAIQLSNTEIKLKRVYYKRGFLGAEKLIQALVRDWISDIQRNQVKNLIKGWGIFNSLIQFFEGFTYLFWYPIEQYKKDGRVLCGIQKGSAAFSTCTILATIELTNRMFQTTKNVAEFFYDLVTPHRANQNNGLFDALLPVGVANRNIRVRRQPNDIREGLTSAYYVMYEGINDTAQNLIQEINQSAEHKGIPGAIGGALRQLPSAALAPIVLTATASCNILSGIRNQLKPDEKKDDDQKWKMTTFNS